MSLTRLLLVPVFTIGIIAASAPLTPAQTVTGDEKVLANHRLTMPTVKKVMAVMQGMIAETANDPKTQERAKLKAQIETLQNKEELTDAEQAQLDKLYERMQALEAEEEAVDDPSSSDSNNQSLADMEAALKKHPAMMKLLAREGITAREYVVTLMALMQAAMVEGFSQGKAELDKLPAGINPENVRFVRENKAELEAMQKALADAQKK